MHSHTRGFVNTKDDTLSQQRTTIVLSKEDIEHTLQGYPPYYRSMYSVRNENPIVISRVQSISHRNPIVEPRDQDRAGWIFAVGLSNVDPVAFYVDDYGHRPGMSHPPHIQRTLCRLLEVLGKDFLAAFPEPHQLRHPVLSAISYLRELIHSHSGSGTLVLRGKFYATIEKYSSRGNKPLDQDAANAMVALFNRLGPLTTTERALLEKHMLPTLQVVTRGVFAIVEYFKDRAVWIPRWLPNELGDEAIYLHGCSDSD